MVAEIIESWQFLVAAETPGRPSFIAETHRDEPDDAIAIGLRQSFQESRGFLTAFGHAGCLPPEP